MFVLLIIHIRVKQISLRVRMFVSNISWLRCGSNKTFNFLGLSSKMSCCVEGEPTQMDHQCCCHVVAHKILQPDPLHRHWAESVNAASAHLKCAGL